MNLNINARFWKWFGNSKVVDDSGKPRVVYHGTDAEFREFSGHYHGRTDDGYFGVGFYFSPDRETANEYGPNIISAYLKIERPFLLPSSGDSAHPSMMDLRELLASLDGIPKDIKPFRKLGRGYAVKKKIVHAYGRDYTQYSVYPKPELYGTPKEIYGPDEPTPIQAIVSFNDQINGVDYSRHGWAESLLKSVDRKNFDKVLRKNGFDGMIVFDPDDGRPYEFVVFDSTQIKEVQNDGTWDPGNRDICSNPRRRR